MYKEKNRTEQVLEALADERSKTVFMVRKHYGKGIDGGYASRNSAFEAIMTKKDTRSVSELKDFLQSDKYAIYGAGAGLKLLCEDLDTRNCAAVWDRNPALWGTRVENISKDVRISPPPQSPQSDICNVLLTLFNPQQVDYVKEYFIRLGIQIDNILTLGEYICGENLSEQYFDREIILPRLSGVESFVDGGCLDLSTSKQLMTLIGDDVKIFAFEPDNYSVDLIKGIISRDNLGNVQLIQAALWNENTKLSFVENDVIRGASHIEVSNVTKTVNAVTIDETVQNEKISYIKLDIEGAELEALHGAVKTILRDKPMLAISVYHKAIDFIDIPEFIMSVRRDYSLYMRHYTITPAETVLYAI
ncbi:FkbM family methyltransferase [Lachnospiraceae bacterium ZAX-1]